MVGALPFAAWFSKWRGVDISTIGDGNPGVFNAWRAAGRGVGLLTLTFDFLKGCLPAFWASHNDLVQGIWLVLISIAPVYGHAFSPFLKGHGGKGLTAAFGVLTALTVWTAPLWLGLTLTITKLYLRFSDRAAVITGFLTLSILGMYTQWSKELWMIWLMLFLHLSSAYRKKTKTSENQPIRDARERLLMIGMVMLFYGIISDPLSIEKKLSWLHVDQAMTPYLLAFSRGIFIYLLLIFSLTLLNTLFWPKRPSRHAKPTSLHVAVFIPARNEEKTIEALLRSLQNQTYPHFTVWVLDDRSTDKTSAIVERFTAADSRFHLVAGQPLPSGWLGKPWALYQLEATCRKLCSKALPDIYLFVDADTWHEREMIETVVQLLVETKADLLSFLPHQEMKTFAEKLIVPIIPWSLFTHFPRLPIPFLERLFPVAIGQVIAMPRRVYEKIDGHYAVRHQVAEDIALARLVAQHHGRVRLFDGTHMTHCRMYTRYDEARAGLGKNLYAFFQPKRFLYAWVWLWQAIVFNAPLLMIVVWATAHALCPTCSSGILIINTLSVLLAVMIWLMTIFRLRLPLILLLYYPFIHLHALYLAWYSYNITQKKMSVWKGRNISA